MKAYPKKKRLVLFALALATLFGFNSSVLAELLVAPVALPAPIKIMPGALQLFFSFGITNQTLDTFTNVSFAIDMGPYFTIIGLPTATPSSAGFITLYANNSMLGFNGTIDPGQTITVTGEFNIACNALSPITISGSATGTDATTGATVNGFMPNLTLAVVGDPLTLGIIAPIPPTSCSTTGTGGFVVNFSGGQGAGPYSIIATSALTGNGYTAPSFSSSPGMITGLPTNQAYTIELMDSFSCTVTSPNVVFLPGATNPPVLGEIVVTPVSCTPGEGTGDFQNGQFAVSFTGAPSTDYIVTVTGVTPGTTVGLPGTPVTTDESGFGNAMIMGLTAGNYNVTVSAVGVGPGCAVTSSTSITVPTPGPVILEQPIVKSTSCPGGNDGSITVFVSGGSGVYQVAATIPGVLVGGVVSKGGSNAPIVLGPLAAGSWSLTVTDSNGCMTTWPTNIVVPTPGAFTLGIAPTNPTCAGFANGYLTVTATGGTGTYVITATPIDTVTNSQQPVSVAATNLAPAIIPNLTAGTYRVTLVDSNNCPFAGTVATLTAPTQLFATVHYSNESCPGFGDGSIVIDASGGTPPYQFSIQGGAPGTYVPNSTTTPPVFQTFSPLAPGLYSVVVMDFNGCTTAPYPVQILPAVAIQVSTRALAPTCPGGSDGQIIIDASGGVAPLMYALVTVTPPPLPTFVPDNVITGLTAGPYQIAVQDFNGCIQYAEVTVPAAAPFYVKSVHIDPISCKGALDAVIKVQTEGGLAPVLFTLAPAPTPTFTIGPSADPVFTNVGPGVYTITITDANTPPCTLVYTTENILDPSALTITSVTTTSPLCEGQTNGTIIVFASGGTPPYQYSADGGATFGVSNEFKRGVGTYSIVVKDAHGCRASAIAFVTQTTPLAIASITSSNVACFGATTGSITITATGGAGGYTYSIDAGATFTTNNVFTGLMAGTYYIAVMDANGCIVRGIVTLTSAPQLIINSVEIEQECVCGVLTTTLAIIASGGTPPLQYSINGGLTFQSSNVFTSVSSGTHTIVVKDANGCTTTTTFTVS